MGKTQNYLKGQCYDTLKYRFFGRSEIKSLKQLLKPDEIVVSCTFGFYNGGSGILVATNHRLLLVDKRPFYLNVVDLYYKEVKGIDYTTSYLQAKLAIKSNTISLYFKSISDARLKFTNEYVSNKILENHSNSFEEAIDVSKYAQNKPYLNPGWRPHHATAFKNNRNIIRKRPSKFYADAP